MDSVRGRSERLNIESLYNKKLTKKDYISRLYSINKNINLIGEYVNTRTKTDHMCSICDYIWQPKPTSIIHDKQGCPQCAKRNKLGGYQEMTKNNWMH